MRACGNLWHHATVRRMLALLAKHRLGQHTTLAVQHGGRGLVTRSLDAQHGLHVGPFRLPGRVIGRAHDHRHAAAPCRHERLSARADPDAPADRRPARQARRRGACHPHHRRRGARPQAGGYRRQGPVRQGDPRRPDRWPDRPGSAQPEGPGNHFPARYRAGLCAAPRGPARCPDPGHARCDRSLRTLCEPAARRAYRHRLGPPPGAASARAPRPRHDHFARQRADPARQAGGGRLRRNGAWPTLV